MPINMLKLRPGLYTIYRVHFYSIELQYADTISIVVTYVIILTSQ